jgi:hypothetical protein
MIPQDKLDEIKTALLNSARPLIFFDDDPDGLCSFLQFYKLNPEAKGIIYKAAGPLDEQFLKKVREYEPDKVFLLDVPNATQDFIDRAGEVYWLDHHAPVDMRNVKYYNPMIQSNNNDNRPTSYWAHKISDAKLWVAMTGCIGDWFIPEDLRAEFSGQYPGLLPDTIKKPEDALFTTLLGRLSRVFSFVLKGTTKSAMTCIKILTRIENPYEILDQSSSRGKFIWKKYQQIDKDYQALKSTVQVSSSKLILFTYSQDRMSLTSDLSNEILFENPDKFIIIARERNGEVKCSLRASKYKVLDILTKSLKGLTGFGGGHMYACGANIKKDDFPKFIERVEKQL